MLSKKSVMVEILAIEEVNSGEALILLNNDFLKKLSEYDSYSLIESIFILARNQLVDEMKELDQDKKIVISSDPKNNEKVSVMKFLIDEKSKNFQLLTYFGGKTDSYVTLYNGLMHCLEVIMEVENNIFAD